MTPEADTAAPFGSDGRFLIIHVSCRVRLPRHKRVRLAQIRAERSNQSWCAATEVEFLVKASGLHRAYLERANYNKANF